MRESTKEGKQKTRTRGNSEDYGGHESVEEVGLTGRLGINHKGPEVPMASHGTFLRWVLYDQS